MDENKKLVDMHEHCKLAYKETKNKLRNNEITQEEFDKWYSENCHTCMFMCADKCFYGDLVYGVIKDDGMRTKLTAENVRNTLSECLAGSEDNPNIIKVEGLVRNFAFDKEKLNERKYRIYNYLLQLSETFRESVGGGYSFLEACVDISGKQWGDQTHAEELLALGIAVGKAVYLFPRQIWNILPGGVPYFVVLDKEDENNG